MKPLDCLLVRSVLFALLVLPTALTSGSAAGQLPALVDVDLDSDGFITFSDYSILAQYWYQYAPSVDIAPDPNQEGLIDSRDMAVLAGDWLQEVPPMLIQWLGHASVKIWYEETVVYVDPRNLTELPHDATVVCVTHSHSDHYAPADIAKVWKADSVFVAPPDVVAAYGKGEVLAPGQTFSVPGVSITGVPAYNLNKTNHPKANNWLGFIIEIGSTRIYVAGDTDLTPEMKALDDIDVAFLPAGGTYSMDAAEAAEATKYIKPKVAVPYHWGEIVGTLSDAEEFARLAACNVKVMTKGEILSSRQWNEDFSALAYWPLDEQEGYAVNDMLRSLGATLIGTPHWQPTGGMIRGAVQLDGVENYIRTFLVLNPGDGPFSVFAWVKTEAPGRVIVSQQEGANWLRLDASGYLGTELKGNGRSSAPLWSEAIVADGDWHRVGLTWNGEVRVLYVDDAEVARGTEATLQPYSAALYIGVGANLGPDTFFSGLIDDVCLHNRAVQP